MRVVAAIGITALLFCSVLVGAMAVAAGPGSSAEGLPAWGPPPSPEPVTVGRIENVFRLSPRLYSGGQPEGEADFAALRTLGIRTVITVDGSRPNIAAARKAGLRYIHLPVGYEGVPHDRAVQLVKAVQESPGPVFVHCHHGKHRGPTAAALCEMAVEGWDRERAQAWLERAGTDPRYKGLFASVDQFVPPSAEEVARLGPAGLPEAARVTAMVDAMVEIDAISDHLKAIERAGFRTPPSNPDLDPPHEALMLAERFRELLRSPEAKAKGHEFERRVQDAERDAIALESALRKGSTEAAKGEVDQAYRRAMNQCVSCHADFRDHRPARSGTDHPKR